MRRKDREITELARIEDILQRARVLHLGLVDGGEPYVVPMHYGYTLENGCLTFYLHSATEGRMLNVIRVNPRAFVELDTGETPVSGGENACKYGAAYESVMGSGRVVPVEDPAEQVRGLNVLMKTQTGREFPIDAQAAENVTVLRIDVDSFTAKRRPMPAAVGAEGTSGPKSLAEMDNRELFNVAAGERGPIAQEYLREILLKYRAKHGSDADLRTMVQTVLEEDET